MQQPVSGNRAAPASIGMELKRRRAAHHDLKHGGPEFSYGPDGVTEIRTGYDGIVGLWVGPVRQGSIQLALSYLQIRIST